MNYQDQIHEAIEVVLAWDIPDEALADAITAKAFDLTKFGSH